LFKNILLLVAFVKNKFAAVEFVIIEVLIVERDEILLAPVKLVIYKFFINT
jgi:hypothetical protein